MISWLLLAFCFCSASLQAAVFTKGQDWQIILSAVVDPSKDLTPNVPVYDVDLFDTPKEVIAWLKGKGKTVICYFSAGTYEDWRSDAKQFNAADLGNNLDDWPGEKWLELSSNRVRSIMTTRIQLAKQKGCDAIDPDNTDGYDNDNGLDLTQDDTIDYMKFLSQTANTNSLKIGLKNSIDVLPQVQSLVDFAVNEQCNQYSECDGYNAFLTAGKPVFNIEYPKSKDGNMSKFCAYAAKGFSTVIKNMNLDGYVQFCNGNKMTTATVAKGTTVSVPADAGSGIKAPASSPAASPVRPLVVVVPTTLSAVIKPASTPVVPATCIVPKGGQCGGLNFRGCTTCVAGSTCRVATSLISKCI